MSSVDTSNTSTYTNNAYSSKGASGLASGLDTESMVKAMLQPIQNKIDKKNQEIQRLEWKQETYRDVIDKVNNFQNNYLSLTSDTSVRSANLFSSMQTTSSSSAVNITNAGTTAAEMSVQVAKLATATTLRSDKLSGSIDINSADIDFSADVTFNFVTGQTTDENGNTIDETTAFKMDFSAIMGADKANIQSALDSAVADAGASSYVSFVYNQDTGSISVGSGYKFSVSDESSSLGLTTLGLTAGKTAVAEKDADGNETGAYLVSSKVDTTASPSIIVSLDGVKKTFSLSKDNTMETLQSDLKKSFGSSVNLSQDGDKWSITAGTGQQVTILGNNVDVLGIASGKSTNAGLSSSISSIIGDDTLSDYSFSINGSKIELTKDSTLKDVIDKVYKSDCGFTLTYNSTSDSLTFSSSSTGAGFDMNIQDDNNVFSSLFGINTTETSYNVSDVASAADFTQGENAVICVDGVVMEKMTNTVTYNGMTMELKDITGNYLDGDGNYTVNADGTLKNLSGTEEKAEVKSQADTDKVMKMITSFVDDYNSLIEGLNKTIREDSDYRKYAPLTDEQKEEMTDDQIEKWEEKAKTGLLRNDSSISTFLTDMRKAIYSNSGATFTFAQIGIDTSTTYSDYGKLTIDKDTLKGAMEKDLAGVIDTFTGTNGVATKLNTICNNAANKSSTSQGSLVKEAGVKGYASESKNKINDNILSLKDKLEVLQDQYETRKNRYWDQFDAMETALSNLNTQSSWLSSALS